MSAADSQSAPHDDASAGLSEGLGQLNVADDAPPKTEDEYAQSQLTLRAIVSSREAGVIIGKAGKNVADLREETGVKAGVSKVVQGVHDRVLTVTGALAGISKAYAIVAKGLLEGAPSMGMGGTVTNNGTHRKLFSLLLCRYHTNMCSSYPSPHLPQPDGYHHRSTGSQDQANPRRFRCSNGRPERDAPTIYRTNR